MIKTQEIDNYVHNLLIKPFNKSLTKEDLKKVKKIVLNKYNIKNEIVEYDYSDLLNFTNLERCSIEFLDITDELINNINLLPNIKIIEINLSKVVTIFKLKNNLEKIILNSMLDSDLDIFENVKSVETLELIEFETLDFKKLLKFENLRNLYIYNSNIENIELINELTKLEVLKLAGSKVDNEEKLKMIRTNIQVEDKDEFLLADA